MRTASDLYRNKPNTSPKMPETPLLQRVSDGEVFGKHLTIRKADKQGDSGLFGEVISCSRTKTYYIETVLPIGIVIKGAADGFWPRQRLSPSQSATISEPVSDYLWAGQRISLSRSVIISELVRGNKAEYFDEARPFCPSHTKFLTIYFVSLQKMRTFAAVKGQNMVTNIIFPKKKHGNII